MRPSTPTAPPSQPAGGATADDGWLPPQGGGRKSRRRWLLGGLLGALVVAITLTAVGASMTLAELGRADVTALTAGGAGPTNWLVVGSDSRANLSDEDKVRLTAGDADGERTDTIFVLSVQGSRAAVLALPRDLWVTRCNGSEGRINTAAQLGGADCLIDTVEATTGLPIHRYAAVDFLGFVDLVDAVGGVEICLERDIVDAWSGANLAAGCQVLTGQQALSYVRVRKIDNDLQRIRRQQQFLAALAARVKDTASPLNPIGTFATARAGAGALTVDDDAGLGDLFALLRAARGIASGGLTAHTVPVTDASINGAAVLLPIQEEAAALFASFADGSVLAEPAVTDGEQPPA